MDELHGRSKYRRVIHDIDDPTKTVIVDIYSVLVAFDVQCPARQHASKKLLCAGIRGKGNAIQDLKEAITALERAVTLERQRNNNQEEHNDPEKSAYTYQPMFLKDQEQDKGKIQVAIGPLSPAPEWKVFLVTDKGNAIGYRVGWPCEDGSTFLVRHYMAGEDQAGPSLNWCKNAAERDATKFNREGKRPEEWSGFHKSAQETKNV